MTGTLKSDRSAKAVLTDEESIDQMKNLREKSPSPELSTREKIPNVTKCPTEKALQEKDNCNLYSYEYASVAQASAKVTKGEPEEVEQHYYYALENPEESGSGRKKLLILRVKMNKTCRTSTTLSYMKRPSLLV